jgi:hypothetical protein
MDASPPFSPPTFPEVKQTEPSRRAFDQSELSNLPFACPSSQPYTPQAIGVSNNFGDLVPNMIVDDWQLDQSGTERVS